MAKRKRPPRLRDLHRIVPEKIRSPVAVVMGRGKETAEFLAERAKEENICFQMDLHQAERLEEELTEEEFHCKVEAKADLWDLDQPVQTLIYPAPKGGERTFKLDMIEQGFHVLAPHGTVIVLSPYENDQLFPSHLKKIFGKVHTPDAGRGFVYWCQKQGDRPRRRHEMTFHVQREDRPSLVFLSRPGVFSYGRFDNGARALVECIEIEAGDSILDIGCGCGTNGVIAGLRSGPNGEVVFVDSNLRACALADINAKNNGLTNYRVVPSSGVSGVDKDDFDVALANPPYFAFHHIAQLFIERGLELLRPGGRFYLVTKQPNEMSELVADYFEEAEIVFNRGYAVFSATA